MDISRNSLSASVAGKESKKGERDGGWWYQSAKRSIFSSREAGLVTLKLIEGTEKLNSVEDLTLVGKLEPVMVVEIRLVGELPWS